MLGPGYLSRYSDSLRTASSGDPIPVGRDFPQPSRRVLGPTQPPIRCLPGHFPGGSECSDDHPPLYSAEVKERVELYLYTPYVSSWPVLGWNLPLPLPLTSPCLVTFRGVYLSYPSTSRQNSCISSLSRLCARKRRFWRQNFGPICTNEWGWNFGTRTNNSVVICPFVNPWGFQLVAPLSPFGTDLPRAPYTRVILTQIEAEVSLSCRILFQK